ncbi:MAG: glycosyltransferase family 39 protein [bacterium]|nr:glycosyltransferase family 39 protein [bacterium]
MSILQNKWIVLGFILTAAIAIISNDFLIKPTIWSDEGLVIQLGRNLAEKGVVQMAVSPNDFSANRQYYTSSVGWVLPTSLAVVFKIFGASFFNARFLMSFYLLGFVAVVFLLMKRMYGLKTAVLSSLLLISFAPLYGNGKSALGEAPAMFWLALGLYFYEIFRQKPMLQSVFSGFGFGLFFASKPAFLILGLPILFLIHLFSFYKKTFSFKWLAFFWVVVFLLILPTIWFGSIHPLNMENILKTFSHYSNNFRSPCVSCDIKSNLFLFLTSATLWHLEFLSAVAVVYLIFVKRKIIQKDWRVQWLIIFGVFNLVYFIKSTGVFRYFFPLQIILLVSLPIFLKGFLEKINLKWLKVSYLLTMFLVVIQFIHLFWFATMYHSSGPVELEKYINKEILPTNAVVGIIGAPVAAAALSAGRYFQLVQFVTNESYGIIDGVNALDLPEQNLPEYIIYTEPYFVFNTDAGYYKKRINDFYNTAAVFREYNVMKKKTCSGNVNTCKI